MKYALLRKVMQQVPDVLSHITGSTRWLSFGHEYKSAEYFSEQIDRLVTTLYKKQIGGEFIDLMGNLISGQLYDAFESAWVDYGQGGEMPDYLMEAYTKAVLNQYDFVDGFYRAIVDAQIDGAPIAPLLARGQLWANQWANSYQEAVRLIIEKTGGNLIWREGDTVDKCDTCLALDGIVMSAQEWQSLGLHPGDGPNSKLQCDGWNCHCTLEPTDKRKSPGGYGRVEEILLATS